LAFSAVLSTEKIRKLRKLGIPSFDIAPFMAVCDDSEEKDNAQEIQQPEEGVDIGIPPEELFVSPEEDAIWEKQKEQCSFCRSFLLSPCAQQFKYWSKCVEVARSREIDYISACKRYTALLMECTAEHQEYFAALNASQGKSDDVNDDDDLDDVNDLDDEGEAQVESSTPDSEVKADVGGNGSEAEGESQ
jgi:hypothetical protein